MENKTEVLLFKFFQKQVTFVDRNMISTNALSMFLLHHHLKDNSLIRCFNSFHPCGQFPILPGNPGFWEIDSKGKRNENNEAMSWLPGKAMS